MPSIHEGFCLPVVEAMACGLPVIAARAGALPETVGDAGLTFTPDDAADLARQVKRLLAEVPALHSSETAKKRPIAVIAAHYGAGVAGGAESSLRTMAESLQATGHSVELFAIGEEAGIQRSNGLTIRHFTADAVDPDRFNAASETIRHEMREVDPETER